MSTTLVKRAGIMFTIMVVAATASSYSLYGSGIEVSPFEARTPSSSVPEPSPGAAPIPPTDQYTPTSTADDTNSYEPYAGYDLDVNPRQDYDAAAHEPTASATYPGYPPFQGFPGYTSSGTSPTVAAATPTADLTSGASQASPPIPPAPVPLPTIEDV